MWLFFRAGIRIKICCMEAFSMLDISQVCLPQCLFVGMCDLLILVMLHLFLRNIEIYLHFLRFRTNVIAKVMEGREEAVYQPVHYHLTSHNVNHTGCNYLSMGYKPAYCSQVPVHYKFWSSLPVLREERCTRNSAIWHRSRRFLRQLRPSLFLTWYGRTCYVRGQFI